VKLFEAGDLIQIGLTIAPHFLERRFETRGDLKAIHCDIHPTPFAHPARLVKVGCLCFSFRESKDQVSICPCPFIDMKIWN